MIHEVKKEVEILSVEFENGIPHFAKISIDSNLSDRFGPSIFSIDGGVDILIHEGKSITKKEIDLIFSAWNRVQALNFSNFTIED